MITTLQKMWWLASVEMRSARVSSTWDTQISWGLCWDAMVQAHPMAQRAVPASSGRGVLALAHTSLLVDQWMLTKEQRQLR